MLGDSTTSSKSRSVVSILPHVLSDISFGYETGNCINAHILPMSLVHLYKYATCLIYLEEYHLASYVVPFLQSQANVTCL